MSSAWRSRRTVSPQALPALRDEAIRRAKHWLAQEPVFLDTETTGLGPGDEVIQVALVSTAGEPLLYTLVRPSRPIPPDSTAIHGLTDADVADAPDADEVLDQLHRAVGGKLILAYNAPFDMRVLQQTAELWGLPRQEWRAECVMRLHAQWAGQWRSTFGEFRWHTLGNAARAAGLGELQAHDALADAQMTRRLLRHIAGLEPPSP